MEGLRKLYTGDFNTMSVEILDDGTRIITLSKDGENKVYRFKVRNLYRPDEELLEHEVIQIKVPEHIKERIRRYTEHAETEQPEHTAISEGDISSIVSKMSASAEEGAGGEDS